MGPSAMTGVNRCVLCVTAEGACFEHGLCITSLFMWMLLDTVAI